MAEAPQRRSVHVGVGIGLPLVAAGALAVLLFRLFPADAMVRWGLSPAVVASVCWAGQLWYVGYGLDPGGLADGFWRRLLGLANAVTLARGALYAVVAGFVVVPPSTSLAWGPALCYGAGVALDNLDGVVARTVGRETEIGRRLDMAFDTFGFVAAPLVAVSWGLLPVWYLSISAARYVFRGAVWLRRVRGLPVSDLPNGDLSRYLAGVQMVFVTVALLPPTPTELVWALAPAVLAPSLAVFARDYLVVSGRLSGRR